MYDIRQITLEDFGAFKGKHTFKFPTEPGLYGITGRNDAQPRLGPNGIGKSTFFLEATYWCNYGRTTRGLRAADVINYDAKSCSVTVEQVIGSEAVTVTRTQSPNSLRLNGQIVDQQTLEKHLRLGPDAFTYAVMFPQFGDAFFDKAPSEKLTLFSQIMELDFWLERSKAADELAKELAAEQAELGQQEAKLSGALSTIKDDIAGLLPKSSTFDAEKLALIKGHKEELQKVTADLEYCRQRAATTASSLQGLQQRLEKTQNALSKLEADKDRLNNAVKGQYSQKAVLDVKLEGITTSLKRLTGLEATCPTCLQKVDRNHLKQEKLKIERAEQLAIANLEEAVETVDASVKGLEKLDEQIKTKRQDERVIAGNLRDFEDEKHALQAKISNAATDVKRMQDNIDAEQKRPNPYVAMIQAKKDQRAALKGQLADVQEATRQTEQDHAATSFWVSGFKRVRLFIIEQALQQLELEINNALDSLGLLDWAIKLDVERENKSGGITKGFTVLVYPPKAEKPVKFESYSGGEVQRLRLAGNLGLANLIMERAGLRNTIEFYDEPSSHLSEEGTLDLAETLMQRALETGRRIFMIEHRLIDYPYTNTIEVIKGADGAYLA